MTELPHPRNSAKLNPPDSILRGGARKRAPFSASAFGLCRKRRRADFAPTMWLGWQDSNLQYQSQSLVCYRYTTSHHRLVQRGRHCRPPAFLGWEMGLEPTTPGTTIRCSYQLSYTHHCMEPAIGTPGGTRTPGLLLRRQLLYPAELLARIHICCRKDSLRLFRSAGTIPNCRQAF